MNPTDAGSAGASSDVRPLVFLSYASVDRAAARRLYKRLAKRGVRCWFDEDEIGLGDRWVTALDDALRKARYILVLVSEHSAGDRHHWQHQEIRIALGRSLATNDPSYLIPILADGSEVPTELLQWQPINARSTRDFNRLVAAIQSGAPLAAKAPSLAVRRRFDRLQQTLREETPGVANSLVIGAPSIGIFISYRQVDEPAFSARLSDWLERDFGASRVFMDINDILPGADFADALDESLELCTVMVVVIGKQWLRTADAAGRRRLDDPTDWVRLEVATGLKRGIHVIPVLVEDAKLPHKDDLPKPLKKLQSATPGL